MDIHLDERSVRDKLSKLSRELHSDRIDRYEIERSLNEVISIRDDLLNSALELKSRERTLLIPLVQTIQDDLYRLQGYTWRSVYLASKRERNEGEVTRLKRELYSFDKEAENLVAHVNEADRTIKELKPKHEAASIGAAVVLIAMSGFLFSSYQSYNIFAKPYTGLSILPSVGMLVYFVFATLLVLAMFALLFNLGKHKTRR